MTGVNEHSSLALATPLICTAEQPHAKRKTIKPLIVIPKSFL